MTSGAGTTASFDGWFPNPGGEPFRIDESATPPPQPMPANGGVEVDADAAPPESPEYGLHFGGPRVGPGPGF